MVYSLIVVLDLVSVARLPELTSCWTVGPWLLKCFMIFHYYVKTVSQHFLWENSKVGVIKSTDERGCCSDSVGNSGLGNSLTTYRHCFIEKCKVKEKEMQPHNFWIITRGSFLISSRVSVLHLAKAVEYNEKENMHMDTKKGFTSGLRCFRLLRLFWTKRGSVWMWKYKEILIVQTSSDLSKLDLKKFVPSWPIYVSHTRLLSFQT